MKPNPTPVHIGFEDEHLLVAGMGEPSCRIELPEGSDPDSFVMPELVADCIRSEIAAAERDHSTGVPSL